MMPEQKVDAHRDRETGAAWALGLVLLQTFAYFVPAATWAPMSRFGLTRALVEERGIELGEWAEATGDRSRRDGVWLSDKAPLPAFAATVPYALVRAAQAMLGRDPPDFRAASAGDLPAVRVRLNQSAQGLLYAASLSVSGLAGVLVGVLGFFWLRRRFERGPSIFAASAIVLASPLFPYSTTFFGHVPAAACLLAALYYGEPQAARRRLIVSGALLAAAAGCEYLAAVPAALIGAYLVLSPPGEPARARLRAAALLALGALPIVVAVAAYHHVAFGRFWETGYSYLANPTFRAGHASGVFGIGAPSPRALFGLTFGGARGLFYLAPVLLPAVVAIAVRWRSVDASVRIGFMAFLGLLLANAGYYMWWGGAATGPRHLVPALFALAPGLAIAWSWARLRPAIVILAVWSALTMLAFAAVGTEAPESGEVVFGYAWSRLLTGRLAVLSSATNLGLLIGLPSLASLVPLWLLWVFGGRWVWRQTRASGSDEAPS